MIRLGNVVSAFVTKFPKRSRVRNSRRCTGVAAKDPESTLDSELFQSKILSHVPAMAESLLEHGYYTTTDVLPKSTIQLLRNQSIFLRFEKNRFEQSFSETIDENTGQVKERFDKEGVYCCEPDGQDFYDATDLITYMSILLQTLPESLNTEWQSTIGAPSSLPLLSNQSFNAKLAVTEHGGSKYPLHVDNPQGRAVGDIRKLTCILYLNPQHDKTTDGGFIRLFLPSTNDNDPWKILDLSPIGGRLLVFWSDEIPHEVLPTSLIECPTHKTKDRYALTIWIPTSDEACLHSNKSKFYDLKDRVFASAESSEK